MHKKWWRRGSSLAAFAAILVATAGVVGLQVGRAPNAHAADLPSVVFPDAIDGVGYVIVPAYRANPAPTPNCLNRDGDLYPCGSASTQFTMAYDKCWSTKLTCYRMGTDAHTTAPICLRANGSDTTTAACEDPTWVRAGSLTQRWRVDTFGSSGLIQLRPASSTGLCLTVHPEQSGNYGYGATDLETCSSTPDKARLWFLVPYASGLDINSEYSLGCWQAVDRGALGQGSPSAVVQQSCDTENAGQPFAVQPGPGNGTYPSWSGGGYDSVRRARINIFYDTSNAFCLSPGSSALSGQRLTLVGCSTSTPAQFELWPTPGYTSFQFRPLVNTARAIDLSIGDGHGLDNGQKVQYYKADPNKTNQHWFVIPGPPWDASHGWFGIN